MRTEAGQSMKTFFLHIRGLVQGVGFRPFIYRLANEMHFSGSVENRNDGVYVKINCTDEEIRIFEESIRRNAPPAAQIHSIKISALPSEHFTNFQIIKSKDLSLEITQVSPDIAVCADCLKDMESQPHRLDYSFINCTNCGPRFSIVRELPYDRPYTSMSDFEMCPNCRKEYFDFTDRRFHAQPIACNQCGPTYKLVAGDIATSDINEITDEISAGILSGKVYVVKGTGGFHLMCDASNEEAVNRIREIKNRDGKPFAIMAADAVAIKLIAEINPAEKELLCSWKRPIVLLKYKGGLASGVCNGLKKIGVMMPYMPIHYQIFKKLKNRHLVLTSGNISDEPIIIDNQVAYEIMWHKTDGILTYNRAIHNRVDDSVCTVINNIVRVNRRSRGYAPQPIITQLYTEGIFAAGAELANSFCIGKDYQAITSQYLGDLKNLETLNFYEETYQRFVQLFRFKPELIVSDLHPDYLSTRFAEQLAEKFRVPCLKTQHHHAHLASAMITQNLDEKIIGVSFDGLGAGIDGNIWGAEFMLADLADFERLYHFEYVQMPGGDRASKEPWRMAISYLYRTFGDDLLKLNIPVLKNIETSKIQALLQVLKKNINTTMVSSAGRLFDAVASIIGVADYNTFQAEAPMRLESVLDEAESGFYEFEIRNESISFQSLIKQIVADYEQGISISVISGKFHNTIIEIVEYICLMISAKYAINKVVLSGGTFMNSYLVEKIEKRLNSKGLEVYAPSGIPVNDQGIALGQLAIAAKRRSLGLIKGSKHA